MQGIKETVIFFTTGGTIAGVATSSTETKDYKPGVLDVGSLIKSVPGIEKVAKISGEQIANIDSSYITNDIWLKLANRVNELLLKRRLMAFVITQSGKQLKGKEGVFVVNSCARRFCSLWNVDCASLNSAFACA